ncbi:RNA ligase [compost metagenome]
MSDKIVFTKYNSIENSYRQAFLDKCAFAVGNNVLVAVEKIHGANFAFAMTDDTTRVAKRSGLISDLETFYGHTRFYSRYEPTIRSIYEMVKAEYPSLSLMTVYGEIFGGRYQGVTNTGAKQVQSGMNYHPDNEFMVFDIRLEFNTGVSRYIPFADIQELLEDANFMEPNANRHLKTAPVIAIGTLEELIAIDPLFYTKVPAAYGIDENHPRTDADYGEGFVIRGYTEDYRTDNGERVILKQKNKLFNEKEKEVKIKSAATLDEDTQAKLDKICSYINTNRLNAVVSKIGALTQKDFGRLQGDLTRDALEDFEKDEGYKLTEDESWSMLAKRVGAHTALTIRGQWLNLIDSAA